MKTVAIIVAGGKGKRMGKPKQFLKIAGKPMVSWTLAAFQKCRAVDAVILVVEKENLSRAQRLGFSKIIKVVEAGRERQDSVRNGLKVLPESAEIVVIHDGARPAVTESLIEDSIRAARRWGAAIVAVPVKDTIKQVNRKHEVKKTLKREELWAVQTPQAFKTSIIRQAYSRLKGKATDDASAVEKIGAKVKIIMGSYENLKVTTPEDLKIIEAILRR